MKTCRTTFGEVIIYQGRVGSPYQLTGIYEKASQTSDFSADAALEGYVAMVDFVSSDLSLKPTRGDIILIPATGESYKIMKPEFDGWSRHRLYLKETA